MERLLGYLNHQNFTLSQKYNGGGGGLNWREIWYRLGRTWLNCYFFGDFMHVLVINVSFSYYSDHPSYN
jgi:hypothetical protein